MLSICIRFLYSVFKLKATWLKIIFVCHGFGYFIEYVIMDAKKINKFEVNLGDLPLDVNSLGEIRDPLKYVPKLTFQGFAKEIVEKYTCMICQEVFVNPVTTNCRCKVNLCEQCFKKNNSRCPICRSHTHAEVNTRIKTEIENQEFVCECKTKYKYGKKQEHVLDCEKSKLLCKKCNLEFNGPQMKIHIITLHTLEVLVTFGRIFIA